MPSSSRKRTKTGISAKRIYRDGVVVLVAVVGGGGGQTYYFIYFSPTEINPTVEIFKSLKITKECKYI